MAQAKRSECVTEAVSALLIQEPFFASLLLDLMEIVEADSTPSGKKIPIAATDGHFIWLNTAEFGKLTIKERQGVLIHEVMHGILQHNERMGMWIGLGVGPDMKVFSHKKWNHAADYIINAYLTAQKNPKTGAVKYHLPQGALLNSQFTGDDIVDEIYSKMEDDEEEKEDGWDEHEEPTCPEDRPGKSQIQAAVAKAAELSKMAGQGVGGMQRLIDAILDPQINWAEHLRRAMTTITRGRDTHTWATPHRRKLATPPHVYYPGRAGWKGPHIAVEIDTSGSITDQQVKVFMGELSGILSDLLPEMVYVMYVDDALHGDVIEIDDVNDISRVQGLAGGGGGTDMGVVFEVIKERQLPVETVVILTDGYTPWPDENDIPTVVCCTTDQKAPEHIGTTVRVRA